MSCNRFLDKNKVHRFANMVSDQIEESVDNFLVNIKDEVIGQDYCAVIDCIISNLKQCKEFF